VADGGDDVERVERRVPPLQFDRSVPHDPPNGEEARALYARMLRARRRAAAAYLVASLLAVCVLAAADAMVEMRPFTLLQGFGLLLNHMGPVLLTVAAIAVPSFGARSIGLLVAYTILTLLTSAINGDELSFATLALAPTLFFLLVGNRWLKTIALVAVLMALVPVSAAALAIAFIGEIGALCLPAQVVFLVPGAIGFLLLERAYDRKLFSDVSIELTFLWIVFIVWWVAVREDARLAWAALAAFALYEAAVYTGLLAVRREARAHRPVSLLVLRVFKSPGRSHRLFERIGTRWRYAGPIHLIGGPDSAIANLDPSEAIRCLTFRIRSLFVKDDRERDRRLEALDCAPDPDGRYRVNDFFCVDEVWRGTFEALLERSDAVLVDLAGYGPSNAGVTYELAQLLSRALPSFVLLTDRTTNVAYLEATLHRLWRQVGTNNPADRPTVRILHDPKAHQLVAALCEAASCRRGETVRL
jgi:hypothetical protein